MTGPLFLTLTSTSTDYQGGGLPLFFSEFAPEPDDDLPGDRQRGRAACNIRGLVVAGPVCPEQCSARTAGRQ